ncbi:18329_t:CDS:2, partial [Rhizophagus irregularis]
MLYKEHITFHEFHTFDNIKYIGDAAARAYTVNSRIYNKPMLMKPIIFNQSFTIQDFVNEVIQHRKVELHDNIIRFYGVTKEGKREISIKGTPSKYIDIYTACWEGNLKDRPSIKQVLRNIDEVEITKD